MAERLPDANVPDRYEISNAEIQAEWAIDPRQSPEDIDLERLDPGHPDRFEANTLWPVFERLRREAPVHYTADSMFGPYWSVSTFDLIKQVDACEKIYSSDFLRGGIRLGGRPREEIDPTYSLPMFIQQDPPKHTAQRKVVAPMFSPRHLAKFESLIRERAGNILDELPENEEFNWVREVSVELTGQMLATLFDVPQEDRHLLIHWSDTVDRLGDPKFFATVQDGFAELWKCWEYFDAVWKERVAGDGAGDDLISILARGDATRDMPPNEYLGNILLLIVGGNDTTRNSISGGVLALNQHPAEYAKLLANPSLIPNMVPEIIRWQSPVAHMARTALEDAELGGERIRAGDRVCMWYISGNRDANAIEQPDQFLIGRRNPRGHLSFGYGVHRCLGNRLGEMQLKIVWEEILKRFKRVEVTGTPQYLRSSFIHGIRDLPVRVHR